MMAAQKATPDGNRAFANTQDNGRGNSNLLALACHCRRGLCLTCARWRRIHRSVAARRSVWVEQR